MEPMQARGIRLASDFYRMPLYMYHHLLHEYPVWRRPHHLHNCLNPSQMESVLSSPLGLTSSP